MNFPKKSKAQILAICHERYLELSDFTMPIWYRRFSPGKSGLGSEVVIEVTRAFVLRVRDPNSGEILAESLPGKPGELNPQR